MNENTFVPLICGTVFVFGVFVLFKLVHAYFKEFMSDMELTVALSMVLDQEMAVSKSGWHLYVGARGEYVLLKFDDKSNAMNDTEERFAANADGKADAVAKFIKKTKKKAA